MEDIDAGGDGASPGGSGTGGAAGQTTVGGASSGGRAGDAGAGGDAATSGAGAEADSGIGGAPFDDLPADCMSTSFLSTAYIVCETQRTFIEAEALCMSFGMLMVRVDSAMENSFVADAANDPWLGASDAQVEGEWKWRDGELFWLGDSGGSAQGDAYEAWSGNEPSGNPATADCARFDSSGGVWVDVFCDDTNPVVCENY